MRVLCINDSGWHTEKVITLLWGWIKVQIDKPMEGPKFGDECIVVDNDGPDYYILAEWPYDSFEKDFFIPLEDKRRRKNFW